MAHRRGLCALAIVAAGCGGGSDANVTLALCADTAASTVALELVVARPEGFSPGALPDGTRLEEVDGAAPAELVWSIDQVDGDWPERAALTVTGALGDEQVTGRARLAGGRDILSETRPLADRPTLSVCAADPDAGPPGDGGVDAPIDAGGGTDANLCGSTSCDCLVQISAGYRHACALKDDGSVWCWGANDYGQLGDRSLEQHDVPVPVDEIPTMAEVRAGYFHTCARTEEGQVYCWGRNDFGQLGATASPFELNPVVPFIAEVAEVGVGLVHTCVRRTDDSVYCWGYNANGQLGDGTRTNRPMPMPVAGPFFAQSLSLRYHHSCALSGGSVHCWGYNAVGQIGNGSVEDALAPVLIATDQLEVGVGESSTCMRDPAGDVYCWGDNGAGQLGDGSFMSHTAPTIPSLTGTSRLAVGGAHACAMIDGAGGGLRCWGADFFDQIGGGPLFQLAPTPVPGAGEVTALSLGNALTCVQRAAGDLACMGGNMRGGLGAGLPTDRNTPALLPGLVARRIFAGGHHACVLRDGGGPLCWGFNSEGQLGDGSRADRGFPAPVEDIPEDVTEIALGGQHSCALTSEGHVWCWGDNTRGQLGIGSDGGAPMLRPIMVDLDGVTAIAAGTAHTCAATADALYCWGDNARGQLGLGVAGPSHAITPTPVPGVSQATALAAGLYHTCALVPVPGLMIGLFCWGGNEYGQLGNGTAADSTVPVLITITGPDQIVAGAYHTCARIQNGSVLCWGLNQLGQLGDGTTATRATPGAVVSDVGSGYSADQITAGYHHVCARRGFTVECWGYDEYGQLGIGSWLPALHPTPVPLESAVEVSAGALHTCARLGTGEVACWGLDAHGQLGVDELSASPTFGAPSLTCP